jgi:hypothetical protein
METEMYRKIMNDRQKEEMVQINMSQMNLKKQREDMMRQVEKMAQGTSPAHIGNGYKH